MVTTLEREKVKPLTFLHCRHITMCNPSTAIQQSLKTSRRKCRCWLPTGQAAAEKHWSLWRTTRIGNQKRRREKGFMIKDPLQLWRSVTFKRLKLKPPNLVTSSNIFTGKILFTVWPSTLKFYSNILQNSHFLNLINVISIICSMIAWVFYTLFSNNLSDKIYLRRYIFSYKLNRITVKNISWKR